jgi:uncharacterized integral membrane protein
VTGAPPPRTPKRTRGERVRETLAFVLGALVVLFAVLNLDTVAVNWIIATWLTPLIVVIVVSLLIGAALGYVVARRDSKRRGRG